jgi:hypothetical protein
MNMRPEFKVTRAIAFEDETHRWSVEASQLRLPPGQWPRALPTDIGNGQPFALARMTDHGAEYRQNLGCVTLTVFND